ncbi:MAG TPA: 4-alpha-glucanotransferase [Candidatus Sulfopaludibacter sp.]|jgi:4-alpha-glucanotransferase|nr:4-alpha-glucanotransferase [Candidatus Sulfopaludibacter sp.]
MSSESFEQQLERAASVCGIEPGFWDIWGRYHRTTTEALQTILAAKGMAAGTPAELENSLSERARSEWRRLLPPCVVAGETPSAEVPLSFPAESMGQRAHFTVRRESGETAQFDLNLWELPQTGHLEMDGRTWVRKSARLPIGLPLGYHDISVTVGDATASTRYIVTPDRAWSDPHLGRGGRIAGVSVSLYGVRSQRNWGCGDFRDLLDVIDWVADELGASFVGLNPLHAIHNRRPFNTSPYLPNCIFYQNFLYLDVEGMEDYANCGRARALRESPEIASEIAALRDSEFVEYERVAALKLRFLKVCFARFLRERRAGSARSREFDRFLAREGDLLEKFALYCALDEHLHRENPDLWIWPDWPAPYQDPDSAETVSFRQKHWRSVLFYQYLQWQIDLQLAEGQRHARDRKLSIGLYHDLALATDRFGSDLWAHRPFFVNGCRVGSPPDDFAPHGQDWGFPPPNAERHREDGYRLFADSIRRNCRHGGALRIDHVMRLFRLYWIPDQCDATAGAYVKELRDDFVRILALESFRNRVVVVGEDLGTVEPAVRETLARFGILSYRLFYFEKNERGEFRPNDTYPRQALVSSTTHDLPTLAGFWVGADIEARHAAGVLDDAGRGAQLASRQQEKQKMLDALFGLRLLADNLPRQASAYPDLTGELHNAIVGFLALTPSQILAINQEDLTKELSQQNLPGTTWQYQNWGRKMRFTIDQLKADPGARGFSTMFRDWIAKSGRKNISAV